jgi:serine/threonine-protein kinase
MAGRLVANRYLLGRRIGVGGMAGIFDGEDLRMGRRVAVKLVRAAPRSEQEWIWREAVITSKVCDPHVVKVLDAGEDDHLGYFMVMEKLQGEDLDVVLMRSRSMPALAVCEIAYQVACALETVHAAGVLHRDLKPGNIFLVDTREEIFVKVLDFGVAKANVLGPRGEALETLAPPGFTIGTPQYMSPEQATGGCVDERTDVYSLGAITYEAIAGEAPTPAVSRCGRVLAVLARHIPRLSTLVRDVDPRLDALVHGMLEGDMEDRPSVREVRRCMAELVANARAGVPRRALECSAGVLDGAQSAPVRARASGDEPSGLAWRDPCIPGSAAR